MKKLLHRIKEERNILHTIKKRKANSIGCILRRNFLRNYVIGEKIEGRSDRKKRKKT
jgi:hypothetical protein